MLQERVTAAVAQPGVVTGGRAKCVVLLSALAGLMLPILQVNASNHREGPVRMETGAFVSDAPGGAPIFFPPVFFTVTDQRTQIVNSDLVPTGAPPFLSLGTLSSQFDAPLDKDPEILTTASFDFTCGSFGCGAGTEIFFNLTETVNRFPGGTAQFSIDNLVFEGQGTLKVLLGWNIFLLPEGGGTPITFRVDAEHELTDRVPASVGRYSFPATSMASPHVASAQMLIRALEDMEPGWKLHSRRTFISELSPAQQEPPSGAPVPGSLALIGLALAALGWARRRASSLRRRAVVICALAAGS